MTIDLSLNKRIEQRIAATKAKEKAAKKERTDQPHASMKYRGLINIDFIATNRNEYQKLVLALIQARWVYLETSAFHIEADLPSVLQSLEIIAKQCQDAGILSPLTLHVQGSTKFTGVEYKGGKNHPSALADTRSKPFPLPQSPYPTTDHATPRFCRPDAPSRPR